MRNATYSFMHLMFGRITQTSFCSVDFTPCFSSITHILPRLDGAGHPHYQDTPSSATSCHDVRWVGTLSGSISSSHSYTRMTINISTKPTWNVSPTQLLLGLILEMLFVPLTRMGVWWRGSWNVKEQDSSTGNSNILLLKFFKCHVTIFLQGSGRGFCKCKLPKFTFH